MEDTSQPDQGATVQGSSEHQALARQGWQCKKRESQGPLWASILLCNGHVHLTHQPLHRNEETEAQELVTPPESGQLVS